MTNDVTLADASLFPRLIVRARGRVIDQLDLKGDLTIGRAEENDLQLSDPKVSRHHARVERTGATFVITDLESANGTRVNGSRLTEPHTLQHGERITIGDTEITYQEPGRSTRDTVTSIGVPPAVQSAGGVPPKAVPPPASADARGRPAETGGSRGMIIGLVVAAAVLLLAITAVVAYLVAPSVFERVGLISPEPTASAASAASPTPEEADETPIVSAATPVVVEETPVTSAVDPQEMDQLLAQAAEFLRQGRFEDATAVYEDLIDRAPDDARPYVGWAWTLILDDEAEQALPHAQKAAQLDPNSSAAAAVLARAYIDTGGEKTEALAEAQRAAQLDPGSAQANAVLSEAYLANGMTQQAVDAADLALVQDANNADAHRVRGWLYHVTENDMGRAASELQIAAGLQPELWLRRHELGMLLYEAEDYTTAILAFQDALGMRPKAITYAAIGKTYYALGQYDQAKASFQQALTAGTEDAQNYGWLALTLAQLGSCDDAQDYIEQAHELDDAQPQAVEAEEICEEEGGGAAPSATTGATGGLTPGATPGATSGTTPGATPEATSTRRSPAPSGAVSGRIAFAVWNAQGGTYDTYIAQAKDGSGRRLLIEGMHQPAFTPDGSWLAVNGEQPERMNLFILKEDGSNLKKVTDFIEDGLPAWSPDGQSLVFSSTRHGDKQSRVYVIDQIPFDRGRALDRTLNFGPDDVRGAYPTWAAGDLIIYQGCNLTVDPGECGLFSISALPGPQPATRLTEHADDTAPAAYGTKIAFMSNREGNWEVYAMNIDGSGVQRLTNDSAHDGLPAWSPDGNTIAFVSNRSGAWAIWAMNPDGSNQRKLFDVGNGGLAFEWQNERISWAP